MKTSDFNKPFRTFFRKRRMRDFESLFHVADSDNVIDIGGTEFNWQFVKAEPHVVLVNIGGENWERGRFRRISGDGTRIGFPDRNFDIAYSNSVIEHVGEPNAQRQMAGEIKRVGKRYFVQTPNRHFPLEPHFFFPGFQFLPLATRIWLLQHFDLGWYKKIPNYAAARQEVETIRLLSRRDVTRLFPEGTLYNERFAGMTVSFVIYAGWPARTNEPKAYANLTK